ncbi:glutamate 5-kinase [Aurantiacibacter spongiae]|uniref:Glutamate 5-kinase n=1 Tax=Aurantiacibacter spongiae TaxID=2488860 RepID=A0A3N5DK49_9SPHN|nr:glutamate 5-kinase [Aurantiacibacter spongiae]RPF72072.1 glutamate 5-kinase [Aurantiacibacter spongiae]
MTATGSITGLSDLADPALAPLVVLKVGSALLVEGDGAPRREWLTGFVAEIAEARGRGQRVVVVSSGAIALGARRLGFARGGRATLAQAQAAAAVGQIALGGLWAELLGQAGIAAAQLLLTLDDLDDRRRYLNAAATIGELLGAGAVPVINENDSVATEEIRFGDNDRLAARVAQAAGADAVLLLSDVDGLYDRDPRDPDAVLLPLVDGVSDTVRAMASGASGSGMGSGGMASKLQAAEIAERAGIALAIVNGTHDRALTRAIGQEIGTLFLPRRHDRARKVWLGGRQRMMGTLTVDDGCVVALKDRGSLLATGIVGLEGAFERGAPVAVADTRGRILGQGLTEYSSGQVRAIMGRRNEDHAALLGHAPRSAVIHRDHLVLL